MVQKNWGSVRVLCKHKNSEFGSVRFYMGSKNVCQCHVNWLAVIAQLANAMLINNEA